MREDTARTYAGMYAYLRDTMHNLNVVIELYSDDPEEALRQSRVLLTTAKNRATEFEEAHCKGELIGEPALVSKSYKLDMKKQLGYLGRSDNDQLLT